MITLPGWYLAEHYDLRSLFHKNFPCIDNLMSVCSQHQGQRHSECSQQLFVPSGSCRCQTGTLPHLALHVLCVTQSHLPSSSPPVQKHKHSNPLLSS